MCIRDRTYTENSRLVFVTRFKYIDNAPSYSGIQPVFQETAGYGPLGPFDICDPRLTSVRQWFDRKISLIPQRVKSVRLTFKLRKNEKDKKWFIERINSPYMDLASNLNTKSLEDWELGDEIDAILELYSAKVSQYPDSLDLQMQLADAIWSRARFIILEAPVDIKLLRKAIQIYKKTLAEGDIRLWARHGPPRPDEKITSIWGMLALHYLIHGDIDSTKWAFNQGKADGCFDDGMLEYSKNLLITCPTDAILVTNGIMDTYGLLYLQIMNGFRPDVNVVCIGLCDNSDYVNFIGKELNISLYSVKPPQNVIIQMMRGIKELKKANKIPSNSMPIYFAITIAQNIKSDYAENLKMVGLAYQLTSAKGDSGIDINAMNENLMKKYSYSSLNTDSMTYTTAKFLQNYQTQFLNLAYKYRKLNDTTSAIKTIKKMNEVLPFDWRTNSSSSEFYSWANKWDMVDSLYGDAYRQISSKGKLDFNDIRLFQMYFQIYYRAEKFGNAEQALIDGLKIFPDDRNLFSSYVSFLYSQEKYEKLLSILDNWVAHHPDDEQYKKFYKQVKDGELDEIRKKK